MLQKLEKSIFNQSHLNFCIVKIHMDPNFKNFSDIFKRIHTSSQCRLDLEFFIFWGVGVSTAFLLICKELFINKKFRKFVLRERERFLIKELCNF